MNYNNPVIPGFYPDPSVCKGNDGYYLVTSSFEYLPGVPLFFSKNLIDWKQIGYCLTKPSQIDLLDSKCSGGIFAPTIRYHQGVYYMITTNIKKGNFFVTSTDPVNGWSDPIFIDPPVLGIDPSLYFEDGHAYVQLSSFQEHCILQFEIDLTTGKLLKEPKAISKGCGGRDVEAPHVYKHHGQYYLLCAEGGTRDGHMVTIQKSNHLWGPYESCPQQPILSNRDHAKEPLQGVGHGDLIEDDFGDYWMVCLGYRPKKHKHILGRETIVLPVEWNGEWPVVSNGYAEVVINTKRHREREIISVANRCDFDEPQLPMMFNTIRDFMQDAYSLQERPGYLRLKAQEAGLNDEKAFTFIGRRQQHFLFESIACFNLEQLKWGECGLSIYMDTTHHLDLCITRCDKGFDVFIKKKVGEILWIGDSININQEVLYLGIRGNEHSYEFYYGENEAELQKLGWSSTAHVSTEVSDSPFTGVYIGMYAIKKAVVDIDWFLYQGKE